MKTLYLECKMGCAGDMLMGALSELVDKNVFIEKMNHIGLQGVTFEAVPSVKCGITGTHMKVEVNGEEEMSHDHHEHSHHEEHHHHHHGVHLSDIHEIVRHLDVSQKVKKDTENIYQIIAEAESKAHGMEIDNIHFHEVGTMDAIADVVGNCVLMEMIDPERVIVSPIALGNGMVKCAHGILPVPAPAVATILQGIPTYAGKMDGELCTPTGAALLKYFATSFETQPTMKTNQIGYGMGNKDFPAANCVRAFLGEIEDDGEVCELTCNLDDITSENIGYAFEVLFKNGALDVYVTSVYMKKNRPGYVFTCMCKTSDKDKMIELMFQHLSTLGIRESTCVRHALDRSVKKIQTSFGEVRVKKSSGYNTTKEKIEFDDLAKIASEKNLSIEEVREVIKKEIK